MRLAIYVCCTLAAVLYLQCLNVWAEGDFEDVSRAELLRAKPGGILRVSPLLGGSTDGGKGYRLLYRSAGAEGEPIAVSGSIFIPSGPVPKAGRDVVAWAHPTSGVVDRCAPSAQPDAPGLISGLADMLARGFVVVATDYEGLGTPGEHPYLVGPSEAHAVLDSVRAARALSDAAATDRFAVWGHSQGGHAALFTAELAARYAPELNLVGIAVAAPATDLTALFEADRDTASGRSLTAMALYSWSRVYNLPLQGIVEPNVLPGLDRLANDCIESISDFIKEERDEKPLEAGLLLADPTTIEPWKSIMVKNTPHADEIHVPVFVAQGTSDKVVRPRITRSFVQRLCASGVPVTYDALEGGTHLFAAMNSAPAAVRWIADRFRREPAPNNCAGL